MDITTTIMTIIYGQSLFFFTNWIGYSQIGIPLTYYGYITAAIATIIGVVVKMVRDKTSSVDFLSFNLPPYPSGNLNAFYFAALYSQIGTLIYLTNYVCGTNLYFVGFNLTQNVLLIPTYLIALAALIWPMVSYQSPETHTLVNLQWLDLFGGIRLIWDNLGKGFQSLGMTLKKLQFMLPWFALLSSLILVCASLLYYNYTRDLIYLLIGIHYVLLIRLLTYIFMDQDLMPTNS
jgi:hypothetical protein